MPADVEAPSLSDLSLGYQPKLGVREGVEGHPDTRRSHERRRLLISRRAGTWRWSSCLCARSTAANRGRGGATTDARSRPSLECLEGSGGGMFWKGQGRFEASGHI